MLKINFNKLNNNNNINLINYDISNKLFNSDQELNNLFIEFINKNKNENIDYDLNSFYPLNVDEFVYKICDNEGNQLFYSDLNFNQNDLNLFSAALRNFKFRINFYNSDNISNRRLVYQININNQFNQYQRTDDGLIINDINNLPIIFSIKKSNIDLKNNSYNIGYYIPLPNKNIFTYPLSLYATYQLLNSKTGDILLLNNTDLIEYKFSNSYYYYINESNVDIQNDGLKKIIKLKIL